MIRRRIFIDFTTLRAQMNRKMTGGAIMNEKVEQALERSRQKVRDQQKQKRNDLALYFNLYTREYAPDGRYSEIYCFFDSKEQPPRYFRKVAQELTDEEFTALAAMQIELEAARPENEPKTTTSGIEQRGTTIGSIYMGLGVTVIIIALIAALSVGSSNLFYGYDRTTVGIVVFVVGLLSSLTFFAIGKALTLLQEISNNTVRRN
jgi:hypothetical protein